VSASFEASKVLIGGLKNRVAVLDGTGHEVAAQELEKPAVALALGPLGEYARGGGGRQSHCVPSICVDLGHSAT
jgi:hypothetical protein